MSISTLVLGNAPGTRDNLIYPLANNDDENWPFIKVTYGYEI